MATTAAVHDVESACKPLLGKAKGLIPATTKSGGGGHGHAVQHLAKSGGDERPLEYSCTSIEMDHVEGATKTAYGAGSTGTIAAASNSIWPSKRVLVSAVANLSTAVSFALVL